MEQQQQDLRRAAAQAFMTSLEQLEQTFEPAVISQGQASNPKTTQIRSQSEKRDTPIDGSTSLDMAVFEEAVADIEAFINRESNHQDL